MALSNTQYREFWRRLYRSGSDSKTAFKALTNLPSKAEMRAVADAIDDRLIAAFPTIKTTDIEANMGGVTVTNNLAKAIIDAVTDVRVS